MSDFHTFGPYRLISEERTLLRGDELVPLTPREFDVLHELAHWEGAPDKLRLLRKIWPGNNRITENNLSQHIAALRSKLGKRV